MVIVIRRNGQQSHGGCAANCDGNAVKIFDDLHKNICNHVAN